MKELNIDKSVILSINTLGYNSTEKILSLALDSEKVIVFGSLHPYEQDIDKKIDEFGTCCFIKIPTPAFNKTMDKLVQSIDYD